MNLPFFVHEPAQKVHKNIEIKVTGWRAKLLIVEHGRLLHCPNYRRMLQPACVEIMRTNIAQNSDHSTRKGTLQ